MPRKQVLADLRGFFLDINVLYILLEQTQRINSDILLCFEVDLLANEISLQHFTEVSHTLIIVLFHYDFELPKTGLECFREQRIRLFSIIRVT